MCFSVDLKKCKIGSAHENWCSFSIGRRSTAPLHPRLRRIPNYPLRCHATITPVDKKNEKVGFQVRNTYLEKEGQIENAFRKRERRKKVSFKTRRETPTLPVTTRVL